MAKKVKFSDMEISQKFMQFDFLLRLFFKEHRKDFSRFGNRYQGQGQILAILKENPVITQKALTRQLNMRPQSASEMINKLEKRGYIIRTKSEEDRRVMIIQLTKEGQQAVEEGEMDTFQPVVLNVLTEEEKQEFGRILDKLIIGMDDVLEDNERRGPRFFRGGPF